MSFDIASFVCKWFLSVTACIYYNLLSFFLSNWQEGVKRKYRTLEGKKIGYII